MTYTPGMQRSKSVKVCHALRLGLICVPCTQSLKQLVGSLMRLARFRNVANTQLSVLLQLTGVSLLHKGKAHVPRPACYQTAVLNTRYQNKFGSKPDMHVDVLISPAYSKGFET